MTSRAPESFEAALRKALEDVHAGYPPTAFEADWAAACAARARLRRRRYRPAIAVAATVLVVVAAGLVLGGWPDRPDSGGTPVAAAAPAGEPGALPLWYAPTDELLQVSSLGFARRPATVTTYDPIHLEVRP